MEVTGYKRSYSVVIRKMLNGTILSGYPKVYPTAADLDNGYFILGGAHIPIMTDNELQTFTQSEYNARIALLKDYVIQQEGMDPFESQFNSNVVYDPENCVPEVTSTTTEQGTTTTSTTEEPTTTTSTTTTASPTTTTTTEVVSTTTTEEAVTTTTTSSEVTTTTTSELPPANCVIIFNTSDNPTKIYTYDYDTNAATYIATLAVGSADVAISHNKLWIANSTTIYEYSITLSPFTISPTQDRTIALGVGMNTTGVGVINNNTLILGGDPIVTADITGATAVEASSFIPSPRGSLTGDVVYNPTSEVYTITYAVTYLGQYMADGTNIHSVNTSIGTLYGLFVHNDIMYAVRANGEVYSINPTTLALTLEKTITGFTGQINGAAQDPRCITE